MYPWFQLYITTRHATVSDYKVIHVSVYERALHRFCEILTEVLIFSLSPIHGHQIYQKKFLDETIPGCQPQDASGSEHTPWRQS